MTANKLTEAVSGFKVLVEGIVQLNRDANPVLEAMKALKDIDTYEVKHPQLRESLRESLRAIQSTIEGNLSCIVDWIARSPITVQTPGEVLPPDLADFIVSYSMQMSEANEFIVLGDRNCQISARLFDRNANSIKQIVYGSTVFPAACSQISESKNQRRWDTYESTWEEIPFYLEESHAVMIAVLPVISDFHIQFPEENPKTSLPYVVADELKFLFERYRSKVRVLNVLVPNSFLYGSGSIEACRNELLKTGNLRSIVQLPSSASPRDQHSYSLVTFSRESNDKDIYVSVFDDKPIRSVDEDVSWFSDADLDMLSNASSFQSDGARADFVTWDLVHQRSTWFAEQLIGRKSETYRQSNLCISRLGEIAEIVRPMASNANEMAAWEISAKNIGRAKPEVMPSAITQTGGKPGRPGIWKRYYLTKGDIVLVTKGTVGLVGVVTDEVFANIPISVSETCTVLRCSSKIPSSALYFYLMSDIGQMALSSRITGSTSKQLRQMDLMELNVPIPEVKAKELAEQAFNELLELEAASRKLEEKQADCFSRTTELLFGTEIAC